MSALAVLVGAAVAATPHPRSLQHLDRDVFKHPEGSGPLPAAAAPPAAGLQDDWDLEHYTLAVDLDPVARQAAVVVTLRARARVDAPGPLVLHGPDGATLATPDGATVAFTRSDDTLSVPLDGVAAEEVVTLVASLITEGADESAWYGLHWGPPIYSMHEPDGARSWLVLYDDPADKATLRWEVTAPGDLVVVTNGTLDEVRTHDDGRRTWVRSFDAPIPPYLFVLHAGAYEEHLDDSGTWDVWTYATTPYFSQAVADLEETSEMLDWASELWLPYPWTHYANVQSRIGGAMEHTTATSFGQGLFGSSSAEYVNAHELGHHWWGDWLTCAEWPEIWLNEGFASYTEALWAEHLFGREGLVEYTRWQRESYVAWKEYEGEFALYDPVYMWGGTVYDKGALVLHMLRLVMGDDGFFEGLRVYAIANADAAVSTGDLQAAMESVHGEDLGWFFEQWVYRAGEPELSWGLTQTELADGRWQVDLHLAQNGSQTWRMPMPTLLELTDGTTVETVAWAEGGLQTTSLCLDAAVDAAELDPEDWVLVARAEREDTAFEPGADACGQGEEPVEEPEDDTGLDQDTGSAEPGIGEVRAGGCGCSAGPGGGGVAGGGLALLGLAGLGAVVLRRRDET